MITITHALPFLGLFLGALGIFVLVVLGFAWCLDRWHARQWLFAERTLQENLDALARCNTVQIVVTCLMGLAAGVLYYFGWLIEVTGGWQ